METWEREALNRDREMKMLKWQNGDMGEWMHRNGRMEIREWENEGMDKKSEWHWENR